MDTQNAVALFLEFLRLAIRRPLLVAEDFLQRAQLLVGCVRLFARGLELQAESRLLLLGSVESYIQVLRLGFIGLRGHKLWKLR